MFTKFHERLKGWRTVIFHGLVGLPCAGLLFVDYLKTVDWTVFSLSGKAVALIGIALSATGIGLRLITDGPVGRHD